MSLNTGLVSTSLTIYINTGCCVWQIPQKTHTHTNTNISRYLLERENEFAAGFALFAMATTYLDAGGYAADGRWVHTERDGWKKAKGKKEQRKDRVTQWIKMARGLIRCKIK